MPTLASVGLAPSALHSELGSSQPSTRSPVPSLSWPLLSTSSAYHLGRANRTEHFYIILYESCIHQDEQAADELCKLGNGDFAVFARMYKEVTIAQANLLDPATAPGEIDRVLRACYVESRPVYIQVPTDMVEQRVPAQLLDTPIDVTSHASDKDAEDFATQVVLERLYEAKRPVFLIDGAVQRRQV